MKLSNPHKSYLEWMNESNYKCLFNHESFLICLAPIFWAAELKVNNNAHWSPKKQITSLNYWIQCSLHLIPRYRNISCRCIDIFLLKLNCKNFKQNCIFYNHSARFNDNKFVIICSKKGQHTCSEPFLIHLFFWKQWKFEWKQIRYIS